jgi:hypothetical protein
VLAEEEVAVVEGCGGDFDDDFVGFWGGGWEGDVLLVVSMYVVLWKMGKGVGMLADLQWVVDLAGLAVYLAECDCFYHDCVAENVGRVLRDSTLHALNMQLRIHSFFLNVKDGLLASCGTRAEAVGWRSEVSDGKELLFALLNYTHAGH